MKNKKMVKIKEVKNYINTFEVLIEVDKKEFGETFSITDEFIFEKKKDLNKSILNPEFKK